MSQLLDFWPTQKDVDDCIKSEAETAANEVILAVHHPMRIVRRALPSGEPTGCSEKNLLEYFLDDDMPEGRKIVPIIGESGVGKSHLIRWLDIHIRNAPGAERRRVIRIPKGSSLRRVLELILEGLEGPRYETIRQALSTAREQLDPIGAQEKLRAEFLAALRREQEAAEQRLRTAQSKGASIDRNDQMVYEWMAGGLCSLIETTETKPRFLDNEKKNPGIIAALARRVVPEEEETGKPDVDVDLRKQFVPDDFIWATRPQNLGPQAAAARAILKLSTKNDPPYPELAAKLMNGLLDDAVRELLGPGDSPINSLFERVRKALLEDGLELVLLIEDFAVLAGLQRTLLDAISKPGRSGNKQELCDMRTALAVTTGYLTHWDTVVSRSKILWTIEEVPADDEREIQATLVEMVGRYLNAARIGEARLKKRFAQRSDEDLMNWVPVFDGEADLQDEPRSQLKEFGYTEAGYPLFPLNAEAVRRLADQDLRKGGKLILNPRYLINQVIRPTLHRDNRERFVNFNFPPPSFHQVEERELGPEVRGMFPSGEMFGRYAALLSYWGGCPKSKPEVVLSPLVYHAFGLPLLGCIPLRIEQSPTLPLGSEGQAYQLAFQALGGAPPYRWQGFGFPPGWKLAPESGVLTAPAESVQGGTWSGTVQCADQNGQQTELSFQLTVLKVKSQLAPRITTPSVLPAARAAQELRVLLKADGGTPPYRWSTGGLPSGWSLQAEGELYAPSGQVHAGAYSFIAICQDSVGEQENRSFNLTVQQSEVAEQVERRLQVLRTWMAGTKLPQSQANTLRNDILRCLEAAMDWESMLLEGFPLQKNLALNGWIYLPNASGTGEHCTAENALVTVCDDETFADASKTVSLELDLRAVIRYRVYRTFDYTGGEEDYARFANFVRRAARQAADFLRRRYVGVEADTLPCLAQSLLLGARLLDLPDAHAQEDARLLAAMFAEGPDPGPDDPRADRWTKRKWEAARYRGGARKLAIRQLAARQGTGDKIFAVDAARLLSILGEFKKNWSVADSLPPLRGTVDAIIPGANDARDHVMKLQPQPVGAAVNERQTMLQQWYRSASDWLSPEFNQEKKKALVDVLKKAITATVTGGHYQATIMQDTLHGYINEFAKLAVTEMLDDLERLTRETKPGSLLSILARADDEVVRKTRQLIETYNDFVENSTKQLLSEVRVATGKSDQEIRELVQKTDRIGEEIILESTRRVERALDELDLSMKAVEEGSTS